MSTIYILSPKTYAGGPETIHQFGKALMQMGLDVKICYSNGKIRFNDIFDAKKIDERLSAYNLPIVNSIVDCADNILIVPETRTGLLSDYLNIRKCILWLSLDYYFHSSPTYIIEHNPKSSFLPKWMYWLPFLYFKIFHSYLLNTYQFDLDKDNVYHMYNCEGVHKFLTQNGIKDTQLLYLCGPLKDIYFTKETSLKRENLILYNPKKGMEFTTKILEYAKNSNINAIFTPIQGMTATEIKYLMGKAKIYMDFGYFPGPERIVREAVIMGCNIITSKTGCAGNNVDVPIPDEFKFETIDSNILPIVDKLKYMLENYDDLVPLFETYREKIKLQKVLFQNAVHEFVHKFHLI